MSTGSRKDAATFTCGLAALIPAPAINPARSLSNAGAKMRGVSEMTTVRGPRGNAYDCERASAVYSKRRWADVNVWQELTV